MKSKEKVINLLFLIMFNSIFFATFCNADEALSLDENNKWDFSYEQISRCGTSDMVTNNECIKQEYKKSNAKLNSLYKQLYSELVNPKFLKESQLIWNKFRDKSCLYELSGLSDNGSLSLDGNSIAYFQKTACFINLTEKRILDLKIYYSWTYDGSPPRKH